VTHICGVGCGGGGGATPCVPMEDREPLPCFSEELKEVVIITTTGLLLVSARVPAAQFTVHLSTSGAPLSYGTFSKQQPPFQQNNLGSTSRVCLRWAPFSSGEQLLRKGQPTPPRGLCTLPSP